MTARIIQSMEEKNRLRTTSAIELISKKPFEEVWSDSCSLKLFDCITGNVGVCIGFYLRYLAESRTGEYPQPSLKGSSLCHVWGMSTSISAVAHITSVQIVNDMHPWMK